MKNIKDLRLTTNLTQKEFSEKFGISLSTLRKWEQGESRTPSYVLHYIELSLPSNKRGYIEIVGKNHKHYFIDKNNKRVGDALGNWISFQENIQNVNKENLTLYIENLFENYYKIVKHFNDDLFFDKKNKIVWR